MQKVRVGNICDLVRGSSPRPQGDPRYYGGPVLRLMVEDVTRDGKYVTPQIDTLTEAGAKLSRPMKKGDLVMTVSGKTGVPSILQVDACIHDGFVGFRNLNSTVNVDYLYQFFSYNAKKIDGKSVGAIFKNLTTEQIKDLEIPLPPLPEQRRIAALLDQADALRQKDRQLLAHYDKLAQSIFLDMFGDPVRNEKGWKMVQAGTTIEKIIAGDSYGGEERPLEEDELGVLKISAVTSGQFNSKEFKAIRKSVLKKAVVFPRKGDLLFSRANTRELVAATCIVDKDYDTVFLPDKLWRIDLVESKCNAYFLKALLSQEDFRYELTKTATGTSGSMLNISMDKLRNLLIWLPPLALQNQFAQAVEQIERQKAVVRQQMAASEALFGRLLQENFG